MATENTPQGIKAKRPLSPHLQVYNPQITSVLSIFHRILGVALSFGSVLLVYWLMSAAYGAAEFERAQAIMGSLLGQLILFGMTVALFYHLANGIRHLFWDAGYGFELPMLRATGIFVVITTVVLTALTWIGAYMSAGLL